jgi:hypothetical protein
MGRSESNYSSQTVEPTRELSKAITNPSKINQAILDSGRLDQDRISLVQDSQTQRNSVFQSNKSFDLMHEGEEFT